MKNNNKKLLAKGVLASTGAAMLTGCVTPSVKEAQVSSRKVDDAITKEYAMHTEVSDKNFFIKEDEGFYSHGKVFRLNEKERLPRFFQENIIISDAELMSLSDISDVVSSEFNIDTTFSEDALAYILMLQENGTTSSSDSSDDMGMAMSDSTMNAPQDPLANMTAPGGQSFDGSMLDLIPLQSIPSIDDEESTVNTAASVFKFKINHNGTLKRLLDSLSSKTGLFWKWENNKIEFFRTQTQTYILNDLPGTVKFTASTGSAAQAQGGTGSGSSTANSKHGIELTSSAQSNWVSMEESITAMLTDMGTVTYSEQTGTITVTDTPTVTERVSDYVEDMNEIISQRILVKVDVYDITYNDTDDVGMNLEALYSGSTKYGFNLAANLFTDGTQPSLELGIIDPLNNWAGSTALVNALKQNFETSLVNSSTSYTTNGIPVPIQILNAYSYLKELTVETDENGAESVTATADVINKGINMSLLPKRMDNGDILLHLSADLTTLNDLRVVELGTSGRMELPDTDQKNFMQRIAVKPGETLLLAGFDRATNESKTNSLFGSELWGIGGSKQGGTKKTKTVILVTPYTMSR